MVLIYEAIDRVNIHKYFLSVVPLQLILGPCKVDSNGRVYLDSDSCLVIDESYFNQFLKLLIKVSEDFAKFHHEKSEQIEVTETKKNYDFIDCITNVIVTSETISWNIKPKNNNEIIIDSKSLFRLLNATTQLMFKSYCYNSGINNSVNSFISKMSKEDLLNVVKVDYQDILVFENYQIEKYLLKEIITRHKKVILLLKELMALE